MILTKVISGGQTGADQAGLRAAKACGIPTGGWLPYGYVTLDGPAIWLEKEYGMKVCEIKGYPVRTGRNVEDSDGTIRFALDWTSRGEICTYKALLKHNKPFIDIYPPNPIQMSEVILWFKDREIKTLNVAGNSEKTAPGIGVLVEKYLTELFLALRD